MDKVLVVRYGAFGDQIYITPVLRALSEAGCSVDLECNWKGTQIHKYNPFINRLHGVDPSTAENLAELAKDPSFVDNRITERAKDYDRVINLQYTLEHALIEHKLSPMYYAPLYARREKNAATNYYDQSMLCAGLEPNGRSGDIFFTNEEHAVVGKQMEPIAGRYVVVWALRGSMYQKAMFWWAEEVITKFCERHPEALIVTMGDESCKQVNIDHPQVANKAGVWPFRQSVLFTKYADLVVTPETGLGVAAGAFVTPKIMLLTAASLKNVVGNDENDFSLQSPAYCSPCTRAIYDTDDCPTLNRADIDTLHTAEGTRLPLCTDFSPEEVLARMEEVYDLRIRRKQHDAADRRPVYM